MLKKTGSFNMGLILTYRSSWVTPLNVILEPSRFSTEYNVIIFTSSLHQLSRPTHWRSMKQPLKILWSKYKVRHQKHIGLRSFCFLYSKWLLQEKSSLQSIFLSISLKKIILIRSVHRFVTSLDIQMKLP